MLRHLSVRLARPDDKQYVIHAVRALTQIIFSSKELPVMLGLDEGWDKIMKDPEHNVAFIAENDEGKKVGAALCGILHCMHHSGNTCYIHDLYVDPNVRSNGTGAAILNAIEQFSKENGIKCIELSQPPPKVAFDEARTRFYEKHGYSNEGIYRAKHLENNIPGMGPLIPRD